MVSTLALPTNAEVGGNVFAMTKEAVAGEWLMVVVPFVDPPESVEYTIDWSFEATAGAEAPGHVLYMEVNPFGRLRFVEVERIDAGDTWEWSESYSRGASGSLDGFTFLVAADVPWSLSVTIETEDAPLMAPLVNEGVGTTAHGAAELVGEHFAPADRLYVEGSFQREAWQHVHVDVDHLQPLGVESYDVVLPGHAWRSPGAMVGAVVPVGGALVPIGTLRSAGTFAGTPGDFSVVFDYAHISQDVHVYVFEMPGPFTLPPGWEAAYAFGGAGGCSCVPSLLP